MSLVSLCSWQSLSTLESETTLDPLGVVVVLSADVGRKASQIDSTVSKLSHTISRRALVEDTVRR